MKKIIIILFSFLMTVSCSTVNKINYDKVNIRNSTELVRFQTRVFNNYKQGILPSNDTLKQMRENVWVIAASKTAPSNIVIRQWCLLDLLDDKDNHKNKIYDMVNLLSYKKDSRIWLEGYSYWLYTREIFNDWLIKFGDDRINNLVIKIDNGFVKTAYLRGSIWHPAPFGDLKNIPLSQDLQEKCKVKDNAIAGIVIMKKNIYEIKSYPIGMNIHIPVNDAKIEIIDGKPANYTFYTSIQNKYPDNVTYINDVLNTKRLNSIEKFNKEHNIDKIIKSFIYEKSK